MVRSNCVNYKLIFPFRVWSGFNNYPDGAVGNFHKSDRIQFRFIFQIYMVTQLTKSDSGEHTTID